MKSNSIIQCFSQRLREKHSEIEALLKAIPYLGVRPPWASFEWQKVKYIIAKSIASCLCPLGCHVYLLEMHGGEPCDGIGDKDLDLAVDCPEVLGDIDDAEKKLESVAVEFLSSILGGDAREKLEVPNIVELHSLNEFIIKRHVGARDQRYAISLC